MFIAPKRRRRSRACCEPWPEPVSRGCPASRRRSHPPACHAPRSARSRPARRAEGAPAIPTSAAGMTRAAARRPSYRCARMTKWCAREHRSSTPARPRLTPVPRAQFLIGDGQVTLGQQVIKPNARKVRQLPRLLGLRVHVFGGPSPCSPGVPIEETLGRLALSFGYCEL